MAEVKDPAVLRETGSAVDRLSPYSTPSATREVLERHGLYTKYGLGQNFLVNDDIIRKIIQLADVVSDDCVLEVGPGIGTLTAALLQHAGYVVAIEKDADLPAVLADTLEPWQSSFALLNKDALDIREQDLSGFATPTKMVSNLPYAVAATVVLDYFQRFDFLESATVMVQKEVADRMMAKPGTKAYGAYTVKLSMYVRPAGRFPVAPGNFFPPPHVESAVLRLDRIELVDEAGAPVPDEVRAAACTMADAAFANRRKTLANSCRTHFSGIGDQGAKVIALLPGIFAEAGIDPKRRGETLSQQEFINLGRALAALSGDDAR